MRKTARAHPNIALVKYWGKRDEKLILPHQSSLSLTLSPISVTTTVRFGVELVELIRAEKPNLGHVKVVSRGDFPAAAGLASSAAGFAALAVAGRAAAGL